MPIPAELVVEGIDGSDAPDVRRAVANGINDFDLKTRLCDILAVYEYATRQRGADPV